MSVGLAKFWRMRHEPVCREFYFDLCSVHSEQGGSAVASSSIDFGPSASLAKILRPRSNGLLLHAQQDSQAEIIGKLERSDDLAVLGKVSGASEYWYTIRTKNGLVGWVREADVEPTAVQK